MLERLCKQKIIRDFLSLFTENLWKQLITSLLEYGIIIFNRHHKVATLSPEDIIGLIEKIKIDENIHDKKKTGSKQKFLNQNNNINLDDEKKSEEKIKIDKPNLQENKGTGSISKKIDSRTNSTSSKKSKKFNFEPNIKMRNSKINNYNSEYKNDKLKIRDLSNDNKSLKQSNISNISSVNIKSGLINKNQKNGKINSKLHSRESSLSLSRNNNNQQQQRNDSYKKQNIVLKYSSKIKENEKKNIQKINLNKLNMNKDDEELNKFIQGNKNKLTKIINNNSSDISKDENEFKSNDISQNHKDKKFEFKGMSNYFKTHLSSSSNSDNDKDNSKNIFENQEKNNVINITVNIKF